MPPKETLCSTCRGVPLKDFLSSFESKVANRPKDRYFTHDHLSAVITRATSCDICTLLTHAVHAGLCMRARLPLPPADKPVDPKALLTKLKAIPLHLLASTLTDFSDAKIFLRASRDSFRPVHEEQLNKRWVHSGGSWRFQSEKPEPPVKPGVGSKKDKWITRWKHVNLVEIFIFDAKHPKDLENRVTDKGERVDPTVPRKWPPVGLLQLMGPKVATPKPAPGNKQVEDPSISSITGDTDMLGREVPAKAPMKLLSLWLSICETYHKKCRMEKVDMGPCPRNMRVIDIKDWRICDLIPKEDSKNQYVTLSYCWGKNQVHKLFKANVAQWMKPKGLPPREKMHVTIRDAVDAVEQLGLRYLWVDALCIVQDDPKVQMDQIQQMDSIYTWSTLTLAAADGKDCDAGLTGLRNPRQRYQLTRTVQGMSVGVRLPTLEESLKATTWSTRGWTYQEHNLAFRIVYFTAHQLYFQCQSYVDHIYWEDVHLEFNPTAAIEDTNDWPEQRCQPRSSLRMKPDPGTDPRTAPLTYHTDKFEQLIRDMMQDYSLRELTVADDIWKAFLGIYNRQHLLHKHTGAHGFISGLPIWYLDYSLLWIAISEPRLRKTNPMFPSWSWYSHDGPVQNPLFPWVMLVPYSHNPLIQDVHVHISGGKRLHFPDFMIAEEQGPAGQAPTVLLPMPGPPPVKGVPPAKAPPSAKASAPVKAPVPAKAPAPVKSAPPAKAAAPSKVPPAVGAPSASPKGGPPPPPHPPPGPPPPPPPGPPPPPPPLGASPAKQPDRSKEIEALMKKYEPFTLDLMTASALDFSTELATFFIEPRELPPPLSATMKREEVGFSDKHAGTHHVLAPILTDDGVWAGTIRLPRSKFEEMKKAGKGAKEKVQLMGITKLWMRDERYCDPKAWMEANESGRGVKGAALGRAVAALAVEEVKGRKGEWKKWSVGCVQQAAWMRKKPKREKVVLV